MAEGSQNALLSNMERLITEKLDAFEHSQRAFTQEQISRLQTCLESHDTYTFRKKGNEEQHKVNARALEKMKEAENHLQDVVNVHQSEAAASAMDKVTQGIDILKYRQKLIRLADSSEAGWRVVHEYEAHPLATDEDDEKKIYRSQRDAERKLNVTTRIHVTKDTDVSCKVHRRRTEKRRVQRRRGTSRTDLWVESLATAFGADVPVIGEANAELICRLMEGR